MAFLCIHQSSPREWTHGELMLVEEVAERIWTADERARAERAAREAMNRLEEEGRHKDQFLAVLSHELRNPLTPIKNGLYLLERTAPGGEKARRAQEVIGRQVDHLCHLVDGLLEINRITRGTIHLHRKQLELTSLVRGTVEDYRSVYESAGVSLEAELPPNPIVLCADASRITQIIGNLLQNAAKFTSPGGRVSIAVSRDTASGQAVIRVSDTGLGMDEKMLARVFEPFKQADTTLDRRQGGLGLGLAHAKGLVELHDGTLEANSAGPGRGAEFTVRLPLDSQPLSERDGRPDPTVTRRRVLVIEDNLDAANSLRDVLELENQEVAVAHSGREGLEKARLFRPDVVLCDIGLPEMDGYEVARAIHADPSLSGVALVALSGYARPEDLGRAANAGFQRHLAKPPNMEQLERLLASLRPGENSLSGRA